MSAVTTSRMPNRRASAWAPMTPPAGPLSINVIGRSRASSAVSVPPNPCMNAIGTRRPRAASSFSMRPVYSATRSPVKAFSTVVIVRSYSRIPRRARCQPLRQQTPREQGTRSAP